MKTPKQMTLQELEHELNDVQEHIESFPYGRYELNYRSELEEERERRINGTNK